MNSTQSPRVFISYTHDSPQHNDRVLELSDQLCAGGIDCNIDQYHEAPTEGWPRWMTNQIEDADYVLVVCTETYDRRFRGKEIPGKGLGVAWEGALVTQELYNSSTNTMKFIPVILSLNDAMFIPVILQGTTRYNLTDPNDYNKLYRRLTNQPFTPKPVVGPISPMPPRDTRQEFEAASLSATPQETAKPIAKEPLSINIELATDRARTLLDEVERLKQVLIASCTGRQADDNEYKELRLRLISENALSHLLPSFIHGIRNLAEFWGYIKPLTDTYAQRRELLRQEFNMIMATLEQVVLTQRLPTQTGMRQPTEIVSGASVQLSIAVLPSDHGYTAVCLDVGVQAKGRNVQDAISSLRVAVSEFISSHGWPSGEHAPIITHLLIQQTSEGPVAATMPDTAGLAAMRTVTAAYLFQADVFWSLLSKESQGAWKGIWSNTEQWDLGDVHLASRAPDTPKFSSRVKTIMHKLTEAWGPEFGGEGLALAPTRYVSSTRATVRLVLGFDDLTVVSSPRQAPAIILPMVREDGEWKFDYLSAITPISLM